METQSSSPQKDFWSFTAKTAGDQKKDQYQIRSIKKQESEVSKNTCQSVTCMFFINTTNQTFNIFGVGTKTRSVNQQSAAVSYR